ncbi:hypothetical protein DFQ27_003215 [Actinomortierella ambigua]|uniref:Bacterial low temperature requirement A protein-domain-containing protein n=1 Tax=Actinomortierella ambigua TaxID=1343610 RepID=A0A9P6Q5A9_9FUNG|nr:hypothetical protein DFQ27_003215 [Actinomortierella ambigua]
MADGQDKGPARTPSPVSQQQHRPPPVHLTSSLSNTTVIAVEDLYASPVESVSASRSPFNEKLEAPSSSIPRRQASAITTGDIPSTLEEAGDEGKGPLGPLRSRIMPNHTIAEGVNHGMQAFRRTLDRMNTAIHGSSSDLGGSATPGSARGTFTGSQTSSRRHHSLHSRVPRTRPTLAQFHNRDQPSRLFVPPPYGQEEVQEAAKVFAAGIARTTAMQEAAAAAAAAGASSSAVAVGVAAVPSAEIGFAMSDTESILSEEEPVVRVHYEIHMHENEQTEPICPLNETNMEKLTQELDLTAEEQSKVREIQDTENLRDYLEQLPREYDVTIVVDEHGPTSPNVAFSPTDAVLGNEMAIVRRESISSEMEERPETDLSAMPVEEPKASWLELFYDLLYVANLTEFTHSHPITDMDALTTYIGWFVILWWTWAGQTFWAARYDMDDLFTKVLKLVEFWALISFGSFSSDHLGRTVNGFIVSYCVQKCVLMIEYGNVHNVRWRYVMWYGSILIEVAVLLIFGRRSSVTFAGSHLPERFALFTIIVLGESIIGLIGLSVGANSWEFGQEQYLALCLLFTVILYSLWWLYFDDFSEDVFHNTTSLSQLWAYLHLPLHVCMVLVGTGALDLIRLYQLEHHIKQISHTPEGLDTGTLSSLLSSKSLLPPSRNNAGMDIPILQMLTSGNIPTLGPNDAVFLAGGGGGTTDFNLTKQYFMAASGAVFLCNSLLKWINLRTYDKFQKIVYFSRLFVSILVFCLMAVPLDRMTPYALLGMMAGFSVFQVAVDLAVIYFGAYGFVEDIGTWVQSARSSIDLGSILPSRFGSRANSVVNLHAFSQLKEHNVSKASVLGAPFLSVPTLHHPHSSSVTTAPMTAVGGIRPSQPPLSPLQQQQLHHQQQQHQQALNNIRINANSLGSSGAYGNLLQALRDIKNRERTRVGGGGLDTHQHGAHSTTPTSVTNTTNGGGCGGAPTARSLPQDSPACITTVHRQRSPLHSPSIHGPYGHNNNTATNSNNQNFLSAANAHASSSTWRSYSNPGLSSHHHLNSSPTSSPATTHSRGTGIRSATTSLHRGDRLVQLMPSLKSATSTTTSTAPTTSSPSLGAAGLRAIFEQDKSNVMG